MTNSFTIKASHPSLKGHFPNNPVVPGVIILDEVIQIIKNIKPGFIIKKLPIVKFIHPLLPEQEVHVEIIEKSDTSLSFSCTHDGIKLTSGQLTLEPLS